MVTPLSEGGGLRALPPFGDATISGLLSVTNFLVFPATLLADAFDFAGVAATVFFCATGLTATAFLPAATGLGDFTAVGLTVFLTGFAGAIFFAGDFFVATFDAGFIATFFAFADFIGFFAATGFFAADFEVVLRAPGAAARATGFERAAAFAAFARLPGLCLIFAIPKPIL